MKIPVLGEEELIRRLSRGIRTDSSVRRGIGDDCAVLAWSVRKWALFASDMLVEGIHFKAGARAEAVGWKALAVNVSDVAAMGGWPRHAVVSLGLPPATPVRWVDGLYRGLNRCARTFGVNLVGGDTTRAPKRIIDVAILGEVEKSKVVYRSGARPGDWILVTGRLGGSLRSGRHLIFTPRLREARAILSRTRPTAMMDLSDGLWVDLPRLCKASGVRAVVRADRVPRRPGCSLRQALTDGEDFELLIAVEETHARRLLRWARRGLPCGLTEIGRIFPRKAGPALTLTGADGRTLRPAFTGFRHF